MDILNDRDFAEIRQHLAAPNLFKVLSLQHYEIRHSNFLGWLLSANETHQCGDTFLKPMLKVLFPNYQYRGLAFEVSREKNNIDIQLDNEQSVLVIENKIRSKDHSNQLSKYRTKITNQHRGKELHFSYLTLFGESPLDKRETDNWTHVSYEKLIQSLKETLRVAQGINAKTRLFIEDYIFSMEAFTLERHPINDLSKHLATKYKSELYECFNTLYGGIDNQEDIEALKFIKSQTTFARGKGFFRRDHIYYDAFSHSFEKLNFDLAPKSNSTYFTFYPGFFKHYRQELGADIPFSFSLRFTDQKKFLRLRGSIVPGNPSNNHLREQIIDNKNQLQGELGKKFVRGSGKAHIGIYSKKIPFNPMNYEKKTLREDIHEFIKEHIECDANRVGQLVLELLR